MSALLLFGVMKVLIGLAVGLQSIEMVLACRRGLIERTVPIRALSLTVSRRSVVPSSVWATLFSDPIFIAIQVLRIVAAFGLFIPSCLGGAAQVGLVLTLFTSFRFLGAFNGGSDAMTVVCFTGLCLGAVKPEWGLYWVGVQSLLSYMMSGLRKAVNPSWWNGKALRIFLRSSAARVSGLESWIQSYPRACTGMSFGVVIFQVGLPGFVFLPGSFGFLLVLGAGFHFANFLFFGLNRFFWIWMATYPAILFLSRSVHF